MKRFLSVIFIIAIVFTITSCGDLLSLLLGGTAQSALEDRIDSFVSKLNSTDRSLIYTDLHPDAESADQTTSAYWDTLFSQDDQPYSIESAIAVAGDDDTMVMVTTITYMLAGITSQTDDIAITFKQDDNSDWLILSIYREGVVLFKKLTI